MAPTPMHIDRRSQSNDDTGPRADRLVTHDRCGVPAELSLLDDFAHDILTALNHGPRGNATWPRSVTPRGRRYIDV